MKVRIKDNVPYGYMAYKYRGQILEVEEANDPSYWKSTSTKDGMFTIIKEDAEVVKEMFEPKSGMVAERHDGQVGFFVLKQDVLRIVWTKNNEIFGHDTFRNDFLTTLNWGKGYKETYLKAIYSEPYGYSNLESKIRKGGELSVLWKWEPEIKELTIKEIADKFGLPVESVRIKDENRSS